MSKIQVMNNDISLYSQNNKDYICIMYINKYKNLERKDDLISNWLRNRNTIEFLGIWKQAGLNSFTLTLKQWIERTNSIGLISKAGHYGETSAHNDFSFEFASWISVEFKLYLIKGFQCLKDKEKLQLGWNIRPNLIKINYRIHTDAIKENLIPTLLTKKQISIVYAQEVDVLNMALFGMIPRQWLEENPELKRNTRDYANVSQLVCLANLEMVNAHFIQDKISQNDRLAILNKTATEIEEAE